MAMSNSYLDDDITLIDVNLDDTGGGSSSSSGGGGVESIPSPKRKFKKPPTYSRFIQQELPACKPIITPKLVIVSFFLIGCIFVPIGKSALSASNKVVEIKVQYHIQCIPVGYNGLAYIQNARTNKTCSIQLQVPKRMKRPVFVYYQLTKFYQNYNLYTKSRSNPQLRSKAEEGSELKACLNLRKDNGKPIVPCGYVAWSMFNDTYSFSVKDKPLIVNKKNIAWESDKEGRFGPDVYPKNFQAGGVIGGAKLNSSIPLREQEDLLVWMRPAAISNFRKLYGRIDVDLEANDKIEVVIKNNYNSYGYGGKKFLVLSTTSALGGKNNLLGFAYLSVGGFCFVYAIIFTILYHFKRRDIGDTTYLSWNRSPAGYYVK